MSSPQNIKILPKFKQTFITFFCLLSILAFNSINAQNSKFTVVLDAGHGGKDPGTVGLESFKKSYESDVALKIVKKLGKFLDKHSDVKTVYTRKTDTFVELHKRGKIANKADGDLFISIHCNSAVTNAYGTTTYVLGMGSSDKNLELSKRENNVILLEDDRETNYKYNPNSNEFLISLTLMQEMYFERSIEFAGIVQSKFKSVAKRKDRGVKQGNFVVLYDSSRPSVLIEVGFLTNKLEEKYLHTNYGQSKIAESIYKAIITYKKRLEKNKVVVAPKVKKVIKKTNYSAKYYKVQISMSTRKIEPKSQNFRGLKTIERVKVGKYYKYFYGVANNFADARKFQKEAIKKGYKDAFVATFKFDKSTSDIYKLSYVNPAIKKSTKTSISKPNAISKKATNISKNKTIFKIQISSGKKRMPIKSYNFKGLKNVERVKIGKYYKYYYGNTNSYKLIKKKLLIAKKKYAGSYIVAVKNGKLISIKEALR